MNESKNVERILQYNEHHEVHIQTLCSITGLQSNSIARLARDGIFVRGQKKGWYMFWQSLKNYCEYRSNLTDTESKDQEKLKAETRLKEAQARRMERQNAEAEGLLIPALGIELLMAEAFSKVFQKLEQIPHRIKRRYPSIPHKHIKIIDKQIQQIQNEASTLQMSMADGRAVFEENPEELD